MQVVAVAVGVVPEVVCLPASALPVLVADALIPVVVAPVPVAVAPVAVAKAVGETRGVAPAVGAVFSLVASAARLAASTQWLRVR